MHGSLSSILSELVCRLGISMSAQGGASPDVSSGVDTGRTSQTVGSNNQKPKAACASPDSEAQCSDSGAHSTDVLLI